jgi:hypothetical protein
MDVDFLWQCDRQEEFSCEALAREHFGRTPTPVEAGDTRPSQHRAPECGGERFPEEMR